MMRSVVLLAALGSVATGAMAADLGPYPRRGSIKDEPIPFYTQSFQWTGFYLGAQIGYAWGDASHSFSNFAPSGSSDPDGWIGGGHIGYNFQSGQLVFGIEADIEGGGVDGSFINNAGLTSVGTTDLNWQGSLRGRLGVAADRTLFYLTAGWAFADVDFSGGPAPGPACCGFSDTLHGWTIGGGVEHMMSRNTTIRLEYRYTDFGETSGALAPAFPGVVMPVDLTTHALRAGVSFKF